MNAIITERKRKMNKLFILLSSYLGKVWHSSLLYRKWHNFNLFLLLENLHSLVNFTLLENNVCSRQVMHRTHTLFSIYQKNFFFLIVICIVKLFIPFTNYTQCYNLAFIPRNPHIIIWHSKCDSIARKEKPKGMPFIDRRKRHQKRTEQYYIAPLEKAMDGWYFISTFFLLSFSEWWKRNIYKKMYYVIRLNFWFNSMIKVVYCLV